MKCLPILLAIALAGCNASDQPKENEVTTDSVLTRDTIAGEKEQPDKIETEKPGIARPPAPPSAPKIYSNKRFKDVTVEKTGEHSFLIKGKGQIFEANFSWVVEDGHEEIKKGYQMTDAGAPEWGNFSFTIDVEKKRANSTLHLILFEISAKDGSRQYELPIFLY